MQAPCGSWLSPVTTDLLVADTVRLSSPGFGEDGVLYWVEGRPSDGGRSVLVRRDRTGRSEDLTPAPFSVRTRVHEYGGLAWAARGTGDDEAIWFVNDADQRIYQLRPEGGPIPLTPAHEPDGPRWRFADLTLDPTRNRLLAVGERHTPGAHEPQNLVVAIDLNDGAIATLVEGHDFFAAPRPSPDGRHLAYLAWDHPNLPWDAAALFVAPIDDHGRAGAPRLIAGDARASAFQPGWAPDGTLVFVHEPTGHWNLFRSNGEVSEPLAPQASEFGLPLWQLGMATWGFIGPREILAAHTQHGGWELSRVSLDRKPAEPVPTPFTSIAHVCTSLDGRALLLAGAATMPQSLVLLDARAGMTQVLRRSSGFTMDPAFVSVPEPWSFPTSQGDTAHAFFYPPKNRDFEPLAHEKPPLVVIAHGGPTGATSALFSPSIQFWTTRGFAVLDVNYRGSTGYGRAYRDRLRGQWGVYDVQDCVAGARSLADAGRVDDRRLAIRGGSAGGFTTLAALAFHDVFRAGASHYGVSDLEALARDTHKFESRYLDALIGPYPERRDLYIQRSPLHAAHRLSCPVIFFQGLEDKVVPPNQTETMVAAMRARRIPVAYLAFEGEQHGFRKADSIKRALESELGFYGLVFGFATADANLSVPIENL